MIILHNPTDRTSREFVNLYGEGHTVLNFPDCIKDYPTVSAFPSVVIEIPAYTIPGYIEPAIIDDNGEVVMEEFYVSSVTIEASQKLLRMPKDWNEVENCIAYVNNRASLSFNSFEEFELYRLSNSKSHWGL